MTETFGIIITSILFGVLGMYFSSFITLLLERLHISTSKEQIKSILVGHSECNNCHTRIQGWKLIPLLGYFLCKGKCSTCGYKIPLQYVYIEALGLVFGLLSGLYFFKSTIQIFIFVVILFFILLNTIQDLLYMDVQDKWSLPFILLLVSILVGDTINHTSILGLYSLSSLSLSGILLSFLCLIILYLSFYIRYSIITTIISLLLGVYIFITYPITPLTSGLVGVLIWWTFFYLQVLISGGRALGGGDLRIGIILGLLYGVSSLFGLAYTYMISGLLLGLYWLYSKLILHKKPKQEIPFVPLLFLSYLLIHSISSILLFI